MLCDNGYRTSSTAFLDMSVRVLVSDIILTGVNKWRCVLSRRVWFGSSVEAIIPAGRMPRRCARAAARALSLSASSLAETLGRSVGQPVRSIRCTQLCGAPLGELQRSSVGLFASLQLSAAGYVSLVTIMTPRLQTPEDSASHLCHRPWQPQPE